jgi:hypothetical protein
MKIDSGIISAAVVEECMRLRVKLAEVLDRHIRLEQVVRNYIDAEDDDRAEEFSAMEAAVDPTVRVPHTHTHTHSVVLTIPDSLNPGIRKTVELLNQEGFVTCDSGDGETHDYPCDRDTGYVVVRVEDSEQLLYETKRLHAYLRLNGVTAMVNANFDPEDGMSFIDVSPIHDRDWMPNGL